MLKTNFSNQELQSKVIDFLRFPLIVGVLFIHNEAGKLVVNGEILGSDGFLFYYCSQFFSHVLGRIAVPLFFFVSGFLFFLNISKFNLHSYESKLLMRAKTLLIPYIFWNLVVFVIYFALQSIPALNTFTNKELDWHNILSYLWNNSGEMKAGYPLELGTVSFPIAYQFWFIRDLMIVVLFSPLIYLICKYTKLYGLITLGILWYFGCWPHFVGFGIVSIFFFTAGAYFGINKYNLLECFGKVRNLSFVLYPIIAIADLLTKEFLFNSYIHKAGILIGIMLCFNLVTLLFERKRIKSISFLSAASFYVFAMHEPLMKTLRKITFLIVKPESDISLTSLYFLNVITIIALALCSYWLLRKFLPKFTAVITGGR
jgi:Uncharacterized protein conserved in bacteria